ncbi:peptidase C14, caspase domain-containing protein [Armillaria borealis]|uniref:Peptidase C14, caspase domain-containing protein n=1 Tax=Armillaria borealis TaxID=47425 RepID=A0AA39J8T8_9AGAR|nr:peptidase C14, caspase domain-containing protein [Armillaria borealis]KAK0438262.1 peptidase C14, caspase domain-containing protein [Armillaria borealis]
MHTLYHRRKKLAHLQMFGHIESESSPSSAPKPPPSIDPSRFWAVVIGIDDYSYSPLRGCVSDAKEIADYLLEDLGIAKDHVQLLLSTSPKLTLAHAVSTLVGAVGGNACIAPTRDNIVSTLLSLSTDPRIEVGDNIIIYFSGHGVNYRCAEYYGNSHAGVGTIEALCPVDRDCNSAAGGNVPDISDREINTILSEISRTKGHHITFILDCCHASTLTRAVQDEGTVRAIAPLPSGFIAYMLQAADENLRNLPGYRSVLAEDWFPNMDSHVILAACKEYEYAREVKCEEGYHGIFTQALTKALKSTTHETTYFGLLEALPSTVTQTPVIAGRHRNAKLWYQFPGIE